MNIVKLLLTSIRTDGDTQPRVGPDPRVAKEYAELMRDGVVFPPVVVFHDGENYWLADGFHRCKAARAAGLQEIAAEVREGTLDDARWHSFGANNTHGLRRSNKDKQRAVRSALLHPRSAGMSDEQIGTHVGVHRNTVFTYRAKMTSTNCASQPATRTGADGRTINVANIGRRAEAPLPTGGAEADATPAPEPEVDPKPDFEPVDVPDETAAAQSVAGAAPETTEPPNLGKARPAEEVEPPPTPAPPVFAGSNAAASNSQPSAAPCGAGAPKKAPARAASNQKLKNALAQATANFQQESRRFVELTDALVDRGQFDAAQKHLDEAIASLAARSQEIEKAKPSKVA